MPKDDLRAVQSEKAALLLQRAYRRMTHKSWATVAERYGLTKTRCYRIAYRTLKVNTKTDDILVRAVLRENDAVQHPRALLRAIRKIAIPFLEARQQSRTHLYLRGGKPWQGW